MKTPVDENSYNSLLSHSFHTGYTALAAMSGVSIALQILFFLSAILLIIGASQVRTTLS